MRLARVCRYAWEAQWRAAAAATRKRIVLPEATDPRTLTAASRAKDFCDVTLVCRAAEQATVEGMARESGLDLSSIELSVIEEHPQAESMRAALAEKRKGKKVPDTTQPLGFANLLVSAGLADGNVSGAITSSGDVVRSAVQIVGMKKGISKMSSFFVMAPPDREPLFFADCAVQVNPNSQELAEIADLAATNFAALFPDREPRVALLSFSTKGSASDPAVDKVTEALSALKDRRPDLICDGDLQLDAAIVPSVGKSKAPGSDVAGYANVLVFPSLEAGNIGYKLTQRLGHARAIGPVLQGLSRPCNDLSRGCSADDIEGTMLMTALQAVQADRQ